VIENSLVRCGIGAIFTVIEHQVTKEFPMKSNLRVVLSAVALAALVAAPAVAKSRTQSQSAPVAGYSNGAVLHDGGHALSSDPDARVRSEIQRDGASSYE
jgi:hypothetical protein